MTVSGPVGLSEWYHLAPRIKDELLLDGWGIHTRPLDQRSFNCFHLAFDRPGYLQLTGSWWVLSAVDTFENVVAFLLGELDTPDARH